MKYRFRKILSPTVTKEYLHVKWKVHKSFCGKWTFSEFSNSRSNEPEEKIAKISGKNFPLLSSAFDNQRLLYVSSFFRRPCFEEKGIILRKAKPYRFTFPLPCFLLYRRRLLVISKIPFNLLQLYHVSTTARTCIVF